MMVTELGNLIEGLLQFKTLIENTPLDDFTAERLIKTYANLEVLIYRGKKYDANFTIVYPAQKLQEEVLNMMKEIRG